MISKRETLPGLGVPTDANVDSQEAFLERIGLPRKWLEPNRWQRRLRKQRQLSRFIRQLGVGKSSPLMWGAPRKLLDADVVSAIQDDFGLARQLDDGKIGIRPNPFQPKFDFGGECSIAKAMYFVHLAQVAPQILACAEPSAIWSQLEKLCQLVVDDRTDSPQSPWSEELLQIELPLTLAHQLPDLDSLKLLVPDARRKLEQSLSHWLDFEGMLELKWWPEHRAILAGWLRCARLLQLLGTDEISAESRQRLVSLFRHSQRAAYLADGALLVATDISCGVGRITKLAESVLGEKPRLRGCSQAERTVGLGSSSEPAGLTIMQTGWKKSAAKIAIDHSNSATSIHLWRNESLLLGNCCPEIAIGETRLEPRGRWDVNCWHCDEDIQVLDLELRLEHGVCLQRTIVLANEDEFLFMADALTSREPHHWIYSLELPVAAGISVEPESETLEFYLRNPSKIVSVVFPLAAPEWKTSPSAAGLSETSHGLTLRQSHVGRHLFAPLFIDLKPRRSVRAHTWRSLTVAKNRETQSQESAVGYRVRSGDDQWLFFRSFGEPVPYSVLSKHLAC